MVRPMVPDRSVAQRKAALAEANRIRTRRAGVKRDLKHGRVNARAVLTDPDCATAKIVELLLAMPKVGRVKAHRMLTRARISPSKTIGRLSERQRLELLSMLPK
jgi:hypothetical protein